MYATDFIYDGKRLSYYNLIIARVDGSSSDGTASSGADLKFEQVKAASTDLFNLYSSIYETVYMTKIQIMKDPCQYSSQSDMYWQPYEVSQIQSWLCQKRYRKFKIDQEGYRDLYWNVVINSQQIMLGGNIIGLELSLYSEYPYAMQDEIEIEYDLTEDNSFSLRTLSDVWGESTPIEMEIMILGEEGSDFYQIVNTLDIDRATEFKGLDLSGDTTIKFDGKNMIVSSKDVSQTELSKSFNFFFPRLIKSYDTDINTFTVNMKSKIKIKYSPSVMVGL